MEHSRHIDASCSLRRYGLTRRSLTGDGLAEMSTRALPIRGRCESMKRILRGRLDTVLPMVIHATGLDVCLVTCWGGTTETQSTGPCCWPEQAHPTFCACRCSEIGVSKAASVSNQRRADHLPLSGGTDHLHSRRVQARRRLTDAILHNPVTGRDVPEMARQTSPLGVRLQPDYQLGLYSWCGAELCARRP